MARTRRSFQSDENDDEILKTPPILFSSHTEVPQRSDCVDKVTEDPLDVLEPSQSSPSSILIQV